MKTFKNISNVSPLGGGTKGGLKFGSFLTLSILLLSTTFALTIQTDIQNAVQTIKKVIVTDDGTSSGNILVELNADSGNEVQVFGNMNVGASGSKQNMIAPNSNWSSIAGGDQNTLTGDSSLIGGGRKNEIDGNMSNIAGGTLNTIIGDKNTIGGGTDNETSTSENSTIPGGNENIISNSNAATIGGGQENNITNGDYGVIPGGSNNAVNAPYGFAAGKNVQVDHEGTFAWSDNNLNWQILDPIGGGVFKSVLDYTFLIRATNGVGINTNEPTATLDVNGDAHIATDLDVDGNLNVDTNTNLNGKLTQGHNNTANGTDSHAQGLETTADGEYSHAEGVYTLAAGYGAHTEGRDTEANGNYSHAEGGSSSVKTIANGYASHAEGKGTLAQGHRSHAEGNMTQANGYASHAEGENTQANGTGSHTEGRGTIATREYSHAQGMYNITGSDILRVVGDGTSDSARHNAAVIYDDGRFVIADDTTLQGDVTINEGALSDSSIVSADIKDGEVKTADINTDAVNNDKLADNSVYSNNIKDGEVKTADINTDAVTTTKIVDGNVTEAKIAQNTLDDSEIEDNSLTAASLATDSVTNDELDNSDNYTINGLFSTDRIVILDDTPAHGSWDDGGILIKNMNPSTAETMISFQNNATTESNMWIEGLNQSNVFTWIYGSEPNNAYRKMSLTPNGDLTIGRDLAITRNITVTGNVDIHEGALSDSSIVSADIKNETISADDLAPDSVGSDEIITSLAPIKATELPSGVDLNTKTTAGFYYQTANADAASSTNYPETRAGSLIVQKSAGTTQQYYTYNDGSPEIWFRAYYNNSRSPRRKVWTNLNDGNGSNLDADLLDGHDTSYFQKRVSDTCSVGSSIRIIHADGTVTCENDSDNDDQTLSYEPTTDEITISNGNTIDITEVDTDTRITTQTCPNGQYLKSVGKNSKICVNDIDTDTQLSDSQVDTYTTNDTDTNYIPKDNGTKLVNSQLVDNGTNVGIGTDSPDQKLSVVGAIRGAFDGAETEYVEMRHGGGNGYINTVGDGDLDFRHDGVNKMSLSDAGDLTIMGKIYVDEITSRTVSNLEIDGHLTPNNTTYRNIGTSTDKWANLYLSNKSNAAQYCDENEENCVDTADIYDSESEIDGAVSNNGYLTSYTETDPQVDDNISTNHLSKWNGSQLTESIIYEKNDGTFTYNFAYWQNNDGGLSQCPCDNNPTTNDCENPFTTNTSVGTRCYDQTEVVSYNIYSLSNPNYPAIGIDTTTISDGLKLDVEGYIGATKYCDENGTYPDGGNCVDIADVLTSYTENDPIWESEKSNYVDKTTNQDINGIKTFNTSPRIKGGSLYFLRPDAPEGYARGINFYNISGDTRELGVGVYGGGDNSPTRFMIGFGNSWWDSTTGISVQNDGNVGIGTINNDSNLRLDVEGNIGAAQYCNADGTQCLTLQQLGSDTLSELSCANGEAAERDGSEWVCENNDDQQLTYDGSQGTLTIENGNTVQVKRPVFGD